MKTRIQTLKGTVRRYAMRPTADGKGERSTDIGGIAYQCEVLIDTVELQYMANRAALNKGGISKAGPVHVKIISRNDAP